MAKQFGIKFGTGVLSATSGLAPTFIHFVRMDTGGTLAPPGITQLIASQGLYKFEYSPSFPIYFQIDGATTGLGADRYITGTLDPLQYVDERLAYLGATTVGIGNTVLAIGITHIAQGATVVAIGNTLVATGSTIVGIGNTLSSLGTTLGDLYTKIGTTASSFGSTSTDPGTIYGFLKRLQELQEGNAIYTKASGSWMIYSRGSSTLLREKLLTNAAATATKA